MTITSLHLFIAAMLAYFLIAGPLLARREIANLLRELRRGNLGARQTVYRWTILTEWGLVAVFLTWWLIMGRTLADLGLQFTVTGWQWIALAVCVVATLQFVLYTHRTSRDPKSLADVRSQLNDLSAMVPHTTTELRTFNWLSITAGICEEVLYRGLLMTALATLTGLWPAVLLSSVVFGVGHAYQGPGGILRTGLVGLVLALVVVFTGSLLAAMVMHAVLDIVQGRLVWSAVNGDPGSSTFEEKPAHSPV